MDEIGLWLEERNFKLLKKFEQVSRAFISKLKGKMKCEKCHSIINGAACPFCYTKEIFDWLIKENRALALEFARKFNYDFQKCHQGKLLA